MPIRLLILFCLCALSLSVAAQTTFTEGIISYQVSILNPGAIPEDPAYPATQKGTFTLQIKNHSVHQRLVLEDGFSNTSIINYATGKHIILRQINAINYAVELNIRDMVKKNALHYGATLQPGNNTRLIRNLKAEDATLTYKKGKNLYFFYLPGYTLEHPEIFEFMPELKGIPALFDIPLSNGYVTHFELKDLVAQPIDNSIFSIPEGYRIISQKEYDKLMK